MEGHHEKRISSLFLLTAALSLVIAVPSFAASESSADTTPTFAANESSANASPSSIDSIVPFVAGNLRALL